MESLFIERNNRAYINANVASEGDPCAMRIINKIKKHFKYLYQSDAVLYFDAHGSEKWYLEVNENLSYSGDTIDEIADIYSEIEV